MLSKPLIIWIILPAGQAVEDTISQLKELLSSEDIVIDGGNTYYKDDLLSYRMSNKKFRISNEYNNQEDRHGNQSHPSEYNRGHHGNGERTGSGT